MISKFNIEILGSQEWDLTNDNLDVVVTLSEGDRYAATLFTLNNLRSLMDSYQATGECASGRYMWATHMIVMRDLSLETIHKSIDSMIESNELSSAFERIG